jgi:hypothetical protein
VGLFSKKTAPSGIPPEVARLPWVKNPAPIDDDFGDPGPAAYTEALRSGDWVSARNVLLGLSPVVRSWAISSKRLDTDPPVAAAERWVAEAPEDGLGHLVLGSLLITSAWEARGGGYAEGVGESAWDVFFGRLQRAEPVLWEASRRLPDAVDPWNQLIWSGIGLQIPLEEITTRYDEGHRRSPFHPQLVSSALQLLCEKWYGNHDQMFAFARMVAAEAHEGSAAIAAVPMAHLEFVLNQARKVPLEEACKSLEGPTVRDELRAAAERSIFHPAFVPDVFGLAAANKFMVAFYQGGHDRETQAVIDLLRGRYCSSPFNYFGDAGRMNRKAEVLTAKALGRPF